MDTIFCPLFKKEVDVIWCIEITDVANGLIKKRVLPDCILRIKNFKEICRNCPNREDDSDAINPFWRHGHYKLLMCIKYNGHLDNVHLTKNKLYEVIRLEGGWFRILNDAGEVEKYPPFLFEVYNFFD
ncbi:hypothetical protein [uncultured Holdemanella sp.]|uniref:hypothetical protein n=1 Tax=uncultured Holdemanella sp. TaxID=1763549 RepID=UPI0025EC471E|nr:hypothetical protein [uncultured Holdemanella sp.]